MRNRCGPGLRGARGRGWGGGAARSPGPRPGRAGAARASSASAFTPPGEPHGDPGITRGLALVRPAQLRLKLHRLRVSLFYRDCDSARILRSGVVQRSASFCPRKCSLGLEFPRWVFAAQRA